MAREEFLEALRLNPDDAQSQLRLSQIYVLQGRTDLAADLLAKAEAGSPHNAGLHGDLAVDYCHLRQENKALAELKLAERYDSDGDQGVQQRLAEGYHLLNNLPLALEHYEKFVKSAKARGVNSQYTAQFEARIADLKQRLTPHFIPAPSVTSLTSEKPEAVLRLGLTPGEYEAVTNPLAASPAMIEWAKRLADGAANETEKAERLFRGLARDTGTRADPATKYWPTASECFAHWADPKVKLNCHDWALLYVAMSRALGLRSFYVSVGKDYLGRVVSHACAGVVLGENALLVEQVALKLAPDWAPPYFWVAVHRINRNQVKEARESLAEGLKHDSSTWLAEYAEGVMASCEEDYPKAVAHLRVSLSLNPDYSSIRYVLAFVLARQGSLSAARDEYRIYLQGDTDPSYAAKAREAVAAINEKDAGN
jgi:tetratricopeptide (TPR) repeat protein